MIKWDLKQGENCTAICPKDQTVRWTVCRLRPPRAEIPFPAPKNLVQMGGALKDGFQNKLPTDRKTKEKFSKKDNTKCTADFSAVHFVCNKNIQGRKFTTWIYLNIQIKNSFPVYLSYSFILKISVFSPIFSRSNFAAGDFQLFLGEQKINSLPSTMH